MINRALTYCLLCFICFFSRSFSVALAQQDSQYTQYIYNTMSINPAYTGGRGRLSVLAVYRQQWTGIPGAPQTLNVSAHSPVGKLGRIGLGVEFTSDKIGPASRTKMAGNFSYLIDFNRQFYISFGLKAGGRNLSLDPQKLHIYDEHNLSLKPRDTWEPLIGIGLYFYTKSWYLGLSTPNFLHTTTYDAIKRSVLSRSTHLYLIGGYYWPVSRSVVLKPSFLIKAVSGAPLSVDVALNTVWYKRLVLGVDYRWKAAVVALAGFQISSSIMIGYAYDYTTSELTHYSSGSHEIFLRFELKPRHAWQQERFF